MEEELLKENFRVFLIHFIQAILNTRFYGPDHPKGKNSLQSMLNTYHQWIKFSPDTPIILTYDKNDFYAGYSDTYSSLKKILSKTEAEMYGEKLKEYFEKAKLISFHINPQTTDSELKAILTIFNKTYKGELERDESISTQVERWFKEYKISNISTLFNEDVIITRKDIPWKVRVVISRLNKDLHILPYFHSHSEKLKNAKLLAFRENLKLVLKPSDFLIFIRNIDLVPEIEKDLPLYIEFSKELFSFNFLRSFIIYLEKNFSSDRDSNIISILPILLDKLLSISPDETTRNILKKFLEDRIIDQSWIPEKILAEIKIDEMVIEAIENPLELIKQWQEKEANKETLEEEIIAVILRLFQEKKFEAALAISDEVSRFHQINWEKIIKETLPLIFELTQKEKTEMVKLFSLAGPKSIPYLFKLLQTAEDEATRATVIKLLPQFLKNNPDPLIKELTNKEQQWYYYRNLLLIAGETENEKLTEIIASYLYHSDPRVKREAADALIKIKGVNSLPTILKFWETNIKENVIIAINSLLRYKIISKWFVKNILGKYMKRWNNFSLEKDKIEIESKYIAEAIKVKKIDPGTLKKIISIVIDEGKKKNIFKPLSGDKRKILGIIVDSFCCLPPKDKKIILNIFHKEKIDRNLVEKMTNCLEPEGGKVSQHSGQ